MDLSLPGKAKPGFDRRRIPCNMLRIEIVVSTQPSGLRSICSRCFMNYSGSYDILVAIHSLNMDKSVNRAGLSHIP